MHGRSHTKNNADPFKSISGHTKEPRQFAQIELAEAVGNGAPVHMAEVLEIINELLGDISKDKEGGEKTGIVEIMHVADKTERNNDKGDRDSNHKVIITIF